MATRGTGRDGLTGRERALLSALAAAEGRAVRADALAEAVWGTRPPSSPKALAMCVHRARGALSRMGADPACVGTVRGVGYRFDRSRDADGRVRELLGAGGARPGPSLLEQGRRLGR